MLICAELPNTSQNGEYELQERYSAPRTLVFKALHFTGDNFIKHNVIVRLLQSEVEHLQKDDPALTAITPANYKFSYKGIGQLEGRAVLVYQLKPRQKRNGLFKGRIRLDAYSGSLMRAEGRLVKSPSFFVKKINFVQDFADIDSFTFPVHIHSEAQVRLLGRTIVDIYQHDYQPVATPLSAVDLTITSSILSSLGPRTFRIRSPTSELYNDAGGYPALPVLGLVAELSHKPICLHQAQSDPFPKPDV